MLQNVSKKKKKEDSFQGKSKIIRTMARVDHQKNTKIFRLRTKFRRANSAALLAFNLPQYTEAPPELA